LVNFNAQALSPYEQFNPLKSQKLPFSSAYINTSHGEYYFKVELADNEEKRTIGLMHRLKLQPNEGMLFDFKRKRLVTMWMRNTFIPLDMIFLSDKGVVLNIAKQTEPHSEELISSKFLVRAVLEVNSGIIDQIGLKLGDKIVHKIFNNN
jgi:hypothetical protein